MASVCVGGGSSVSVHSVPVTKADAAVSTKRSRFKSGGRRLPSVPGSGRGRSSGASLTRSSGQPFPCVLKVTEDTPAAQESSRDCPVMTRFRPPAKPLQGAGEVLVQVHPAFARRQRAPPHFDGLRQAARLGERHAQSG